MQGYLLAGAATFRGRQAGWHSPGVGINEHDLPLSFCMMVSRGLCGLPCSSSGLLWGRDGDACHGGPPCCNKGEAIGGSKDRTRGEASCDPIKYFAECVRPAVALLL